MIDWSHFRSCFSFGVIYLFNYLALPGFLAGMPQQRKPITAGPWRPDHNTGNSVPYSLRIVCGFFNIPQLFYDKGCETGPPAYGPYPRRLEILTICWCNYKGSTFYAVILRPWMLVRPESNSQPPAWQLNQLSHWFAVLSQFHWKWKRSAAKSPLG